MNNQGPGGSATDAMSNYLTYLRQLVGETGSDDFYQFQQYLYAQSAELRVVKRSCEQLREALTRSQEERQDLELRLVAEEAHRDEEAKNAITTIEKNNIQLNAQVYSMKCEVETWKQRAEATSKESHLLKEQLRAIQLEKLESARAQSELTEKISGFENFQQQFEFYAKRIRDTTDDLTKQLNQCKAGSVELAKLLEAYKKEVGIMNVHVKAQRDNSAFFQSINRELEQDLVKSKAELKQLKENLLFSLALSAEQNLEIDKLKEENAQVASDYSDLRTVTENIRERIQYTTEAYECQAKKFQENMNLTAEIQLTTEEVKKKTSELEDSMKWMQGELAGNKISAPFPSRW